MNETDSHMVWDQKVADSNSATPTTLFNGLANQADSACTGCRPVTAITPTTIARFWAKVAVAKPEDCWLWTGAVSKNGYGSFRVPELGRATQSAHWVGYRLGKGVWPPAGLLVRHTCDNRRCVNLDHLEIGTHADNMRDMVERGRAAIPDMSGQNNHNAKLNGEAVTRVREQISQGRTNKAIGKAFGVTHSMISRIRRGKSWSKPE